MTTYQDVNWDSLSFIKKHLYRRLATPLNNALGRLAIARHVNDPAEAREQFRRVEQSLEIALNLVKAWAALVHVKSGGAIRQEQRRLILPDQLPAWLVEHLNTQTAFLIEHTQPILAHPETFYESLLLVCLAGSMVGTLKKMVTCDAPGGENSIWLRVIFEPPISGPYANLGGLFKRYDARSPLGQDVMFQLQVLQEFLRINHATLRLQNNRRSGEQALTVCVPVAPAGSLISAAETRDEMFDLFPEPLPLSASSAPASNPAPLPAAESCPPALRPEPSLPGTGPFELSPAPGVIEKVTPENASDTLIVPPPDYRRRLGLHRPTHRTTVYPSDGVAPIAESQGGEQNAPSPGEA
jgi:hypothetical protein